LVVTNLLKISPNLLSGKLNRSIIKGQIMPLLVD
jgi:hypothetical protein